MRNRRRRRPRKSSRRRGASLPPGDDRAALPPRTGPAALLLALDLHEVARAFAEARIGTFVLTVFGFCLVIFLFDSLTWTLLVRRTLGPVRTADVMRVKSVSYFLDVLSYMAAAAGAAYMVHRIGGFSFLEAAGALLWLTFIDVLLLVAMMSAGWLVASDDLPSVAQVALPWVLAVGWAIIAAIALYWHGGLDFGFLGRFRRWRLFETFARATLADVAVIGGVRLAFLPVYAAYDWAVLPPFDIRVDFDTMLVYSPILAFAQTVPGTISGLGAVQPLFIALYTGHVDPSVADPAARIFAFTTSFGVTMTAARLVFGHIFLGGLARAMLPSAEEIEAARAGARAEGRGEPRRRDGDRGLGTRWTAP